MKTPKAPAAPDPVATANAQAAMNKETAYWNASLNNVNQITPYGNLTFKQTSGGKIYNDDAFNKALSNYQNMASTASQKYIKDATGKQIINPQYNPNFYKKIPVPTREQYLISDTPPQFTSTVELSPEQKQLLDSENRSNIALANLGEAQLGRITQSVADPFSYDGLPKVFGEGDSVIARGKAEEALMSRLNPQFQLDEEALRTRLINQGIGQGSEAYNREMNRFGRTKNDARQQAVLGAQDYARGLLDESLTRRNQAIQEYTAQRNAPLNEFSAFTSGNQIQNPQFQNIGYQGANPVDYAGLVEAKYQSDLNNYNQKVAGRNSLISGIAGIGGSFLGGPAGGVFASSLMGAKK